MMRARITEKEAVVVEKDARTAMVVPIDLLRMDSSRSCRVVVGWGVLEGGPSVVGYRGVLPCYSLLRGYLAVIYRLAEFVHSYLVELEIDFFIHYNGRGRRWSHVWSGSGGHGTTCGRCRRRWSARRVTVTPASVLCDMDSFSGGDGQWSPWGKARDAALEGISQKVYPSSSSIAS